MKTGTLTSIALCCVVLAGCGGHGFEGEYKTEYGNKAMESLNEYIRGTEKGDKKGDVFIGSNYIESQSGTRTKFDKVFVRKSAQGKYLIFDQGGKEEAWKIVDKKTLTQLNGFGSMTLRRVN